MAGVWGLAAALLWGVGDFLARFAGRGVGVWRTLFYGQIVGLFALQLWMFPHWETYRQAFAAWSSGLMLGMAVAPLALIGSYAFTKALTAGTLSLVVPIATSYGAVSAVLAIAWGEPVTTRALVGIIGTVIGVTLATAAPSSHKAKPGSAGVGWALIAAGVLGTSIWLQGRFVVPAIGSLPAVLVYFAISIPILVVIRLANRGRFALSPSMWPVTLGAGLLTSSAGIALALGFATGHIAIVAVLSTLSSVVTALLGYTLLDERLAPRQLAGVVLAIAGVATINAG
ncbi:MAG: DMT family transporter [Methylobacteriaceae bacterium]|nr:DMT family transporter [Methylobacteriaceae bacterium]